MASKKHLHGSRREHLISKRRFTVANVLLAMVAVVAGYWVYSQASAASYTASGRILVNEVGRSGITLECDNSNVRVQSNSVGSYSCTFSDKYFYIRGIPNRPSGMTGGASRNQPEHKRNPTYEWQVHGINCYHSSNTSACPGSAPTWDLAFTTGLDFRFYQSGTRTISGKVTVNGLPRSGVTLDCNHQSVTTNASGAYSCTTTLNEYYAIKVVSGLPSGASGGPTNNRSSKSSEKIYNWQRPAVNCFSNSACDHPYLTPEVLSWDRGSESGFDFAYATPAAPKPQCSDGKDNDGDGRTDTNDPGCSSTSDNSESPNPPVTTKPQCSDGKDNDGDGRVDTNDAGCVSTSDNSESPNPGTVPPPPGVKPNASDRTAPSVPGGFKATSEADSSNVNLTWKASTDSSGIKNYLLQRSQDRTKWETVSSKITGTSYTDVRTEFKTAYFYRLRAVDNAGNNSGYATTEITTGEFVATEAGTTIQSDDGVVQVTIPDGALAEDASCSIVKNEDNTSSLGGTQMELVYGPYEIVCKKANGDLVAGFEESVLVRLLPQDDAFKNFKNLVVFKLNPDTNEWEAAQITTEEQDGQAVLSFNTDKPVQFAVVGERKPGAPWGIISFIILIILIAIAVFVYLLRKAQKEHYQDYLRRKYYNL